MNDGLAVSAANAGTGCRAGRAGRPAAVVVALALDGGASLAAVPAHAAAAATSRQAIVSGYAAAPVAGINLPWAVPGNIVRLGVAVLVDDVAAATIDLDRLRELIGAAAGIDAGRGDRLAVAAMPMHTGTAAPAVAASGIDTRAPLRAAIVAAALIVLIGGVLLAVRQQRTRTAAAAHRRAPLRVRPDDPHPPASAVTAASDRGLKQQRAIASVDPAGAAQQLRGWIGPGR
ncbi:flagellar M-ring protein FliF C-terminal domain-containing protein [Actinoplanes teichomyceticus]|uniref:Flagellar M-ring protein n=1 Tax=Actinoplanes teichomyceticus TaxID=1867 RepID=A0A561WMG5_ACTTI|nr:flagellar M-ring protein FliF C-terminal domain-containing protein [Actinoplanes teichomyceticus]TWG25067.1 flagellar M-ring protein [Actinoplanes teichomyceticus]GIF10139.1 hypothetical protein Ate01nite_01710 [Actinoplanes teichomyceticus]